MSNRDSIEKFVRNFYAERLKNQTALISPLVDPDGIVQLVGSYSPGVASIDEASPATTLGMQDYLSTLVTTWEWKKQTIHNLLIESNEAAVRYTLEVVYTPTGKTVVTCLISSQ